MANSKRRITKLARLPKKLLRADLERRGPLRQERFHDLTGRKYQRCRVLGLAGFIRGYSVWLCRCGCGERFLVRGNALRREAHACGCGFGGVRRHRDSNSAEYAAWRHLCAKHSGELCVRWRSYVTFLADIGRRPGSDHILVRLNKARQYGPSNVCWLRKSKALARRRSIYLTYRGRTLSISGWARRLGISNQAMQQRIARCKRNGAPLSEALTTPPGQYMPTAVGRIGRPRARRK